METARHNAGIEEGYIDWCSKQKGLQDSTCEQYRTDMDNLQAFLNTQESGKRLRFEFLNAHIIEAWARWQMERGYSTNTVNRALSTASQLGAYMAHEGMTKGNIMADLTRPRRKKTLPKPADTAQVTAYLKTQAQDADALQLHALVALQMQTGVRISEALGLTYKDIDKGRQALTIRGKGGKERRVYYTADTAAHLNRWAQGRKEREGRIFTWGYYEAYTRLRETLRKEGRGITPHQLRHSFATRQLEQGTDVMTLAAMMGHADISTTRRYTRISDARQRQAFTS